ncbi:MAG: arylsulfatase [Rikenellaceae bacterium]
MKTTNLLTASLACVATLGAAQAKESQPNVVFIMVDDLGYGDLSCYGAELINTPNIDKLAAEGRQFLDAHSASAVSTPSRYSMLTGQYPFRGSDKPNDPTAGIWGPLRLNSPLIVEDDLTTVAEVMKAQGYTTGCVGKWHLGWSDTEPTNWNDYESLKTGPCSAGFDYFFGLPHVSSSAPYFFVENNVVVGGDPENDPILFKDKSNPAPITPTQIYPNKNANKFTGGVAAHALYKDDEMGEMMAKKSVAWIKANKDKPFFLYLATPHIHHPFTPGKQFLGSSKCGLYGDFIQEMDWIVGEVLNTLEEEGLDKNTLVIFTSDNGAMFNAEGRNAFNAGHRAVGDLLGFKFDVWEGGHRVPFIARWPKHIKSGSTSDQLISNVDLLATMAALTGYQLKAGEGVDSYNMLEALVGNPKKMIRPEFLLTSWKASHQAIREGDWIYIPAKGGGGWDSTNPKTNAWGGVSAAAYVGRENSDIEDGKLKADAPKAQLYNIAKDLSQTTNVIEENPEVAKRLAEKLAEIKKSTTTR